MARKLLINQLELAYNPVSNYDFTFLRNDPHVQKMLSDSSIYIIAQRSVITFENLTFETGKCVLNFEIRQKGNPSFLKVRFPILQLSVTEDLETEIAVHLYFQDKKNGSHEPPFNDLRGMRLFQEKKFVLWLTPEKFLYTYWIGQVYAEIEGDIRNFTTYKVHYVGRATDQDVWKRLTGHATLQDILSIENPLNHGSLPTEEITLLLFQFKDNIAFNTYGPLDTDLQDMVASIQGTNLPEQKTIFLDAEKALVKAMQPKYNKEGYKSYPLSKDGLHKHNLTGFTYTFMDPISLIHPSGIIAGGLSPLGGDSIIVKDNETMEIIREH